MDTEERNVRIAKLIPRAELLLFALLPAFYDNDCLFCGCAALAFVAFAYFIVLTMRLQRKSVGFMAVITGDSKLMILADAALALVGLAVAYSFSSGMTAFWWAMLAIVLIEMLFPLKRGK